MMNLFSDDVRRNPFPVYARLRETSPALRIPPPFDAWAVFDYAEVRRVLTDHEAFSSRVPAPKNWFIFSDPPGHTKMRALVSKAFTPRVVTNLEPRIRELSAELLDRVAGRGQMDLAADYAVPLPMMVIAEMIGIPSADWPRFKGWSDVILALSHTRSGGDEAKRALQDYIAVTEEMGGYLAQMIARLRVAPAEDLLSRLLAAEVDGDRLTHEEILGFFQLLIVAGQETTANLINNSVLCLLENPDQLALLRSWPELLPSAIEEVLRYRSPFQWIMRTPRAEVAVHGHTVRPGELVLAMVGSANRDRRQFPGADRFDITRDPNPHLAFGHGIHFCLGAALSRLEARIALTDLLGRLEGLELASTEPWEPRAALHVHGPTRLPVRFRTRQ